MKVYKKLAQAREMLQESGLKKTGKGYGFSYFELSDFLPRTNEIFAELGLASFTTITIETAKMTICDAEDGSTMTFEIPFANFKSDEKRALQEVQELGGSVTYMTRYLWVQVMNIVEPDSIDSQVQKVVNRMEAQSTRTTTQETAQQSTTNPNDDRPSVGTEWVDDNGHTWVVKRRKDVDIRYWQNTVTNATSHIG